MPPHLSGSKVVQAVMGAEGSEFDSLRANIDDIKLQLFIDTATWGLDIYEKELGIKTDYSKTYADRRAVIKSKLRGTGKVDKTLLKLVADAYTNGDVAISFNNRIIIKFTSVKGIPPNINDLKGAIEEIKPAHLAVMYEYAYLLIKDIHNVLTINELQNITLDKFAGGE